MNPQPPVPPMWTCSNCSSSNEGWRGRCRNCNTPKGLLARSSSAPYGSPEYLAARDEAIARIVAEAPPPSAAQIVTLRRIFANAASARREAA